MDMDVNLMTDNFTCRPVWAQIDLDAAAYNMQQIRHCIGPNRLITTVLKANAYGHGAIEMAKVFVENGADVIAVACLDEGVELRRHGVTVPIIILGHTDGGRAEALVYYNIDAAVFHYRDAVMYSKEAQRQHKVAHVQFAVDTGMGRIGYRPTEESIEKLKAIAALPNIVVEGMFTHFAVSDMASSECKRYTDEQYRRFMWFKKRLEEEGVHIKRCHCCSSAGLLTYDDYRCDMVRPGIVQYGYHPSDEVHSPDFEPHPVMSLHACITHIKTIDPGDTISYGRHFTANRKRVIATIPLGYADGYPRIVSNKVDVLVHGKRAHQVGNMCMDQCMIDITDIPDVRIGDEAVIFGSQCGVDLPLEELSRAAGTIDHEILCNIDRRVPRIYTKGGQIVKRVDYILRND